MKNKQNDLFEKETNKNVKRWRHLINKCQSGEEMKINWTIFITSYIKSLRINFWISTELIIKPNHQLCLLVCPKYFQLQKLNLSFIKIFFSLPNKNKTIIWLKINWIENKHILKTPCGYLLLHLKIKQIIRKK